MAKASLAAAFLLALASAAVPAQQADPAHDPFGWLEDERDPRTQAFYREQAAHARASLDRIPGRGEMLARIRALSAAHSVVSDIAVAGTRLFYLRRTGEAAAVLCMREGFSGPELVLVDPAADGRAAPEAAIEWLSPSPDGRHVAFGVGAGGRTLLRVLAVQGVRLLPVEIDRTRFNRGLAWHPDGRSFYYARVPREDAEAGRGSHVRIYRHVLGRDASRDEVVFAPGVGGALGVGEYVRPRLHLPPDSRYAYAIARDGTRPELAVYAALQRDLAAARPRWHRLAGHEDEVLAIDGSGEELYVLSARNAPRRRVLRVRGNAASLAAARVVVPQGDAAIEAMGLARDALYLRSTVGGVQRLERVPLGLLGARAPEFLRIPFDNAVSELVTDPRAAGAIVRLEGWIEPPAIAQVQARGGELRTTGLQPPSRADFSAMDEVRLYAPAADGVKIPVTLVYRKTTRLTRDNPLLVTAHGSFGESLAPSFDPARLAWLERGGILAFAHVRGGGEYGSAWHRAGRGSAKATAIGDLVAVCEFLLGYGFTNPRRMAVMGTGVGAIPAAGALVRRPDLFTAAVLRSPLTDLERYERGGDGPSLAAELGSAATPEGRAALRALSPQAQVRSRTVYPAVMLTTSPGARGPPPWHAAKLAAALQEGGFNGYPVLLRVADEAREAGEPRDEELADIYAFLLWQMGDARFAVPIEPPGTASPGPA